MIDLVPQGGSNYTLLVRYRKQVQLSPDIEPTESVEEIKLYCNTHEEIKDYFHYRLPPIDGNLMVVSVYDRDGRKNGFFNLKVFRESGEEEWTFLEKHD